MMTFTMLVGVMVFMAMVVLVVMVMIMLVRSSVFVLTRFFIMLMTMIVTMFMLVIMSIVSTAASMRMAMIMIMTVTMPMMVMRAAVTSMWLVDTLDSIHEVIFLTFHARQMAKSNKIKDITSETNKRCQQHDLCIKRLIMLIQNSICCLDSKPDNHAPDNEDACQCSQNLSSMIPKR